MFTPIKIYDGTFDQEDFDKSALATADQDGLMSKEDKVKLDSLAEASNEEITLTAADVGLENVTNDAQVKRTEMGVANGVATLDEAGLVPASQLPAYVDDVEEAGSVDEFPAEGEGGKIYVDTTANKAYRWTGSQYVVIPEGIALGETASTAYPGDKGKAVTDVVNSIVDGTTSVPKAVDAETVAGFTVAANVPADAVFTDTDTIYEHPETHDADMIVESAEKKFATEAQLAKIDAIPDDAVFTDTVYEHPETHPATMIEQDETHRFVTDEQIANWGKDNDTTYVPATPDADGLMAAADKAKLDELYTIPTTPYYDEADNVVYGCGMGITIEAAEEAGKIKIKYADTEGEKEFTAPEAINIYGGGDGVDNPVNYPAACVTMNSGKVKYIYGGNRRGSVGNVVIIVNGGTMSGVIAGGHSAGTRESIVGHAEVIINNTDAEAGLVYAGGQGLAVVGTTRLVMNGGSIGWLTAGGSHGHTAMAEVIVNDGTIKVLQGCNRGTMGSIKTTINGGIIEKVFAGGETGDSSVNATYAKCEMTVNGGTIGAISAGTNGGVVSADNVTGTYAAGVISDEDATAMNLTKVIGPFTDIVVEGNALVFKNGDIVVKSVDLSAITV